MNSLIGKSLEQAKEILSKEQVDYEIVTISGGKDENILQDMYVVRVRNKDDKLELTVTGFKTTI